MAPNGPQRPLTNSKRRDRGIGPRDHFFPDGMDPSPARQRFMAIHRELRERIILLRYPPGTKLDVDRLAEEFKVSRTPIRSVLQHLEYQGLVVMRHGVSTAVADIDFDHLRQVMEFRMRLAEMIGELSPLPPQPSTITALEDALERCQALRDAPDLEEFGRIDIMLHESVCTLIGNPLLRQVYDELYYRTVRMWFIFLLSLDWIGEVEIFRDEIEATLRMMQRGDTRGVGYLVRNAVAAAVNRLGEVLDTAPAEEQKTAS